MWAQFSVTVVVRGRYRSRPAADHRRYLDVALARPKAASGFLLGWWRRSSSRSCCSLLLVVGAARAGLLRLPVTGVIKIILGALLLFSAPGLWDSGSEPVPLRGRIRCGT
jgi:hypothetical protein